MTRVRSQVLTTVIMEIELFRLIQNYICSDTSLICIKMKDNFCTSTTLFDLLYK
jgi:hypothetical protein